MAPKKDLSKPSVGSRPRSTRQTAAASRAQQQVQNDAAAVTTRANSDDGPQSQQPAPPAAVTTAPTLTFEEIDAKARPFFLEQTWFGGAYKKRAIPSKRNDRQADVIYRTGAYTMYGPDFKRIPEGRVPKMPKGSVPYTVGSSKLDKYMAKEEPRHVKEAVKSEQLIRHGLATRDHNGQLHAILAVPEGTEQDFHDKKEEAQRAIENYEYESSDDEKLERRYVPGYYGESTHKGRLAKLKQDLAKIEKPRGVAAPTRTSRKNDKKPVVKEANGAEKQNNAAASSIPAAAATEPTRRQTKRPATEAVYGDQQPAPKKKRLSKGAAPPAARPSEEPTQLEQTSGDPIEDAIAPTNDTRGKAKRKATEAIDHTVGPASKKAKKKNKQTAQPAAAASAIPPGFLIQVQAFAPQLFPEADHLPTLGAQRARLDEKHPVRG